MSDRRAVIVCEHVAQGAPILRGARDEPLEEADSGWQFLCNSGVFENQDNAQVWALHEVLEIDPALGEFIDHPPGTVIVRESASAPWKLEAAA